MSLVISLQDFVNQMDTFSEEWRVYLNRRTGEFLTVSEEDRALVESEDDADVPDWQRELLPKIREAVASDDWLELPSKWELNEYRIMERFCGSVADDVLRADLLDTIGGRGTFGRFKNMIHRHNLWEDWERFREEAFREIAREWLKVHGIRYRG